MSINKIFELINERWSEQSDNQTSFLKSVELPYEIFKKNIEDLRSVGYVFNPNKYNGYDDDVYYVVFIECGFGSEISFIYN